MEQFLTSVGGTTNRSSTTAVFICGSANFGGEGGGGGCAGVKAIRQSPLRSWAQPGDPSGIGASQAAGGWRHAGNVAWQAGGIGGLWQAVGRAAVDSGRGRRTALQEYCRHAAIMENGAKKYIFETGPKINSVTKSGPFTWSKTQGTLRCSLTMNKKIRNESSSGRRYNGLNGQGLHIARRNCFRATWSGTIRTWNALKREKM